MNSNKPYSRSERVGKQILDILSEILLKNIDLSYLGFVTFTNVKISNDLKSAKVFYSVLNQKLPDVDLNIEINKKQKAFKKFMGPEINIKSTPSIRFYLDESLTYAEKINKLFKDSGIDYENNDSKY